MLTYSYNYLLQTLFFLREKEGNHLRVGGGGLEKRSGYKINSTYYSWGKNNQQIHYKSLCLYRKVLFMRYKQCST